MMPDNGSDVQNTSVDYFRKFVNSERGKNDLPEEDQSGSQFFIKSVMLSQYSHSSQTSECDSEKQCTIYLCRLALPLRI